MTTRTIMGATWVAALAVLAWGCGDDGGGSGDTGMPDTGMADSGMPDSGAPDTGGGDTGGGDGGLPTDPPSDVSMVSNTGFQSPGDAIASPDGATFYFTAFTDEAVPQAAVFSVASDGSGGATALHTGAPFEYPTGLVASCDGATLYVADQSSSAAGEDMGALYAIDATGGTPTEITSDGIGRASGLALADDCATLWITGWTDDGTPAAFTLPVTGGTATVEHGGAPFRSPTGIHVDVDNVAWILDHIAVGSGGAGVLYSLVSGEEPQEVVSGLRLGTPGGVSLTAGGGTAVIGTRDRSGMGQLTTVRIADGEITQVAASAVMDPSGLRTARGAGVFAVADNEGDAIFRAE